MRKSGWTGLAAAGMLASCAGPMGPTPQPVAPTPTVSAADQMFVTTASQGNLAEIAEAKLALMQSRSSRVKSFAQQMIDDHQNAETQLTTVAGKIGATVATAPSDMQQSQAADLGKLSGRSFDKAYVADEVVDHQTLLGVLQQEAAQGGDADLKAYASSTATLVSHHLDEAKALSARPHHRVSHRAG